MKKHTFPKEERLHSERLIADLFRDGSSFLTYPYRITFLRVDNLTPNVQILFSVSKRRFRRAVDRNRLKRRMREAYRLQKGELLDPAFSGRRFGLAVAVQYVAKEELAYSVMYAKMAEVLKKLYTTAST